MGFKSRAELDERTQFLQGANKGEINLDEPKEPWRIANWSPQSLKKLTIKELEDQWQDIERQTECVADQGQMMIWFICLRIRDYYPSDRQMGEYKADLIKRKPTHPLAVGSQQTHNKWANAARWCAEMKITSLPEVGLSQKAVFLMSSPANKDISKKLFNEFKKQNVSASVIERRIAQLKSVATIEKPKPEPEKMEYDRPVERYTVKVEDNVVQQGDSKVEPLEPNISHIEHEAIIPVFEKHEQLQEAALKIDELKHEIILDNEARINKNNINRRMDMILALARENAAYLTKDQQKEEIKLLVKSYQLSFLSEAGLLQECAKEISAKGYGK